MNDQNKTKAQQVIKDTSWEKKLAERKIPRPALLLIGYLIVTAVFSLGLVLLDGPDQVMLLFTGVVIWASIFYPRWVYLAMFLILVLEGIWVVYHLSDSFSASLQTIVAMTVTMVILTEIFHRLTQMRLWAADELQEQKQRYRALFERTNDAVFIIDLDDTYLEANQQAADMLGCTIDDIVARTITDFISPDERADANAKREALQAGETLSVYERTFRRIDGTEFPVEVNVALAYDAKGKPSHLHSIVRDITVRKQAEEQLRETRNYLENLIGYANAPIIVFDPDFRITRFNRAFARLTGRSADEVLGGLIEILFPDERRTEAMAHIRRTMEGKRWEAVEIPILHVKGEVRTVLWNSATLYAADDTTAVATIAQGVDITERKQAEAERLVLAVERERVKLLGDFITDVSHEFRTPLAVISTSLYVLKKSPDPEMRAEKADVAQEQVSYIAELIDAMLTILRLDGGVELTFAPLNLNSLLRGIETQMRTLADEKQIAFMFQLDGELPSVPGDEAELHEALTHIVRNALDYTPGGGTITLRTARRDDVVAIEVADTGIGISDDDLPHIFEHFYRVDKARTTRKTGLGLTIAKKIVEAHGGSIEVESAPDAGSTFRALLPINAP